MNNRIENMITSIAAFVSVVGIVAGAFFAVAALRGYVISQMWGWFIFPTFKGVPQLGITVGFGIAILVSFLTHKSSKPFVLKLKDQSRPARGNEVRNLVIAISESVTVVQETHTFWKSFGNTLASAVATLGLGWIVHLFM